LQYEINSSKSDTTNFSPKELHFITPPQLVVDALDKVDAKLKNTKAETFIEDFKNKRDKAHTAISIAQQTQAKYIDFRKSRREFAVGDLVFFKFNKKPGLLGYLSLKEYCNKIEPTSIFFRIVKKLSPLTYKLALSVGFQIHDVVSIIYLWKYGKDDRFIRPLPVVEGEKDKKEWKVEEILDYRLVKEKKEYLVK